MNTHRFFAAGIAGLVLSAGLLAPSAHAAGPAWTKNCTALNKKYPHGVGKAGAVDKTSNPRNRVKNFRKSTKIYNEAMRANKGLDRDKDSIACEKR